MCVPNNAHKQLAVACLQILGYIPYLQGHPHDGALKWEKQQPGDPFLEHGPRQVLPSHSPSVPLSRCGKTERESLTYSCVVSAHNTCGLLEVAAFKKSLSCHLEEKCVTFLWPVHPASVGRCQSLLDSLKPSSKQTPIFLPVVSTDMHYTWTLMPRNLIYLSSPCWRRRTDILKTNNESDKTSQVTVMHSQP